MDDMDFSHFLMGLLPAHFEEVRKSVNMEAYCFVVRNAMVNHMDRYEKLCTIFHVPFVKGDEKVNSTGTTLALAFYFLINCFV
jgi:hypothetical protein